MTVSSTDNKFRYEGNGVTDTFSFPARLFATGDLVVEIITRATDALEETLTETTDYTVTINGDESASVVTVSGKIPSATQDIQIRRSLDKTQTVDLPTGTVFPAVTVENALDRATAIVQDTAEEIARSIKLPITSTLSDIEFPVPVAGGFIKWNSAADALETKLIADIGSASFPVSSTDNAVVRFDGTGGVTFQDSGVTVSDTNNVSGVVDLTMTGNLAGVVDLTMTGNLAVSGTVDGRDVAADGAVLDTISTITTTKGDIAVHNGTNEARLAVGTDGQALIADSGETLGVKWGDVSGGLVLLATASASASATVDFTSSIDSTYDHYIFELINVIPATDGTALVCRVSTDGGSTWKNTSGDYERVTLRASNSAATPTGTASTTDTSFIIDSGLGISNVTSEGGLNGTVVFSAPSNASSYTGIRGDVQQYADTEGVSYGRTYGVYAAVTAVNAVQFLMTTGNITSGEFKMYGVKKS